MPTAKTSPKVDGFLRKATQWREEYAALRKIALDCGLTEDVKWGFPCYTSDGKNVVLIHGFKEYCAFLFFKGILLKDPRKILIQQTERVQSSRQIRFTSLRDIASLASALEAYIRQAIEVEKAGLKVAKKTTSDFAVPEEFQKRLDENPALKQAYDSLTPGRQRGYLYFFSSAKQSATRTSRVDKYLPQILQGKGMDD